MPDIERELGAIILKAAQCELASRLADTLQKREALQQDVADLSRSADDVRAQLGASVSSDLTPIVRLCKDIRRLAGACSDVRIQSALSDVASDIEAHRR